MADYSDLTEFVMPPPGNTCNVSGVWIEPGETVYATSYDAVRTGGAIRAAVARPESVTPIADPIELPATDVPMGDAPIADPTAVDVVPRGKGTK